MARRWRDVFAATDYALALLTALAVLALTLLGARGLQLTADARRETADRTAVADVAIGVAQDLERSISVVSNAARDLSARLATDAARLELPGGSPVGFVPTAARSVGGSNLLPVGDPDGEVAALLDRATDSAQSSVSAPVQYPEGRRTVIAAAVYQRDPEAGRPATATARRARVTGWIVAAVDLDALVESHLPRGAVGAIRDGRSVVSIGEPTVPASLPERTISVGGREFVVRAGDTSPVRATVVWVALVAGVVLAIGAAAGVLLLLVRLREQRATVARREAQVDLIGNVAPLVQQSLDLAEVLPAVAVQLTDHFGLAGVAMSMAGRTSQVRLFSMGAQPDPTVEPVLRPEGQLRPGSTLVLAMQRGGRRIARLELVAGRELDTSDLRSLRALVELITAAIVNASLYASQQEALRNLQELDALKTVFLGTASHELRTPATAIAGFAALLAENWERFDEDQRRDFVSRIDANARSLSAVVQDLLDFSLLDGGTVALTIETVDLPALVRGVVGRLSPVLTDHEITLQVDPAPEVDGDVNGLERAITNLLTNAVKFSPPGTTITVAVGPTPDGGAEVSVSDQGPGIAPEERARVFTRFYRGSGDEVVQTRGVGIGLSVVAELAARLNGDVILDAAPGGGARFTIRLPRSQSAHIDKETEDATTT